jgi:hypothetical protein
MKVDFIQNFSLNHFFLAGTIEATVYIKLSSFIFFMEFLRLV